MAAGTDTQTAKDAAGSFCAFSFSALQRAWRVVREAAQLLRGLIGRNAHVGELLKEDRRLGSLIGSMSAARTPRSSIISTGFQPAAGFALAGASGERNLLGLG